MSAQYEMGICGCGMEGIVVEITDRLWNEFFRVDGLSRPKTVAGCVICRLDWSKYAGALRPIKAVAA
jgi:hypothetical protein